MCFTLFSIRFSTIFSGDEDYGVNIGNDSKLAALVGAAIAARRKKKGLTQAQFAELLDITQDSLSRMEKGVIAPKFSRLHGIATALGCPVADLFRQLDDCTRVKAESIADRISTLPPELQDLVVELVEKMVETLGKRRA